MTEYSNIIQRIRESERSRQNVTEKLATDDVLFAKIKSHILKNSGNDNDALSIFDDAIISFIKKAMYDKSFKLDTHVHAYLFGTAKNMWYNELRKMKRSGTNELIENIHDQADESNQESIMINKDNYDTLKQVLELLGTKCKEVLLLWAGGYKMTEIAELVGYKDERVARKTKSLCFSKLTNYLNDNPTIKGMLEP